MVLSGALVSIVGTLMVHCCIVLWFTAVSKSFFFCRFFPVSCFEDMIYSQGIQVLDWGSVGSVLPLGEKVPL